MYNPEIKQEASQWKYSWYTCPEMQDKSAQTWRAYSFVLPTSTFFPCSFPCTGLCIMILFHKDKLQTSIPTLTPYSVCRKICCETDLKSGILGAWFLHQVWIVWQRLLLRTGGGPDWKKLWKTFEEVARPTQGFWATADDGFSTITTRLFTLLCLHMNF